AGVGHNSDRTRIAAQIVTGVGFLGAGAIIHGKFAITGLTSAATIWAIAAIGMTVGFGYAAAGLALSLLVLALLTIISAWEQQYIGPCQYSQIRLTFDPEGGKTLIKIEEILDESNIPLARTTLRV